jgi:hypothetical protein
MLISLVMVYFGGVGGVAVLATGTPEMAGFALEGSWGRFAEQRSYWVILSAQCQLVLVMISSGRRVC